MSQPGDYVTFNRESRPITQVEGDQFLYPIEGGYLLSSIPNELRFHPAGYGDTGAYPRP
jgi:hypothetical protein